MSFAKFLIDKWKNREKEMLDGSPDIPGITAVEGPYYSTLTGSDPPEVVIDWNELEAEISKLEEEFKNAKK